LLAEALLESGRPAEALTEFETSLKIYPARLNGLLGAARAADKVGQKDLAAKYYRAVLDQCRAGDGTRPELAEARERVSRE
jgi:Tfp pilus assembly protein PilF